MRPATKLLFACAALALALGYSAYEWRRMRQAEAALAALLRPLPPPPVRPKPAVVATAAPPAKPTAEISDRVKTLIAQAPSKGPGGVPLVYVEDLFADLPTLKAAYNKAAAAQQRLGYGQFIWTIGLSSQEEARFLEILANREAVWGDIRASATNQGLARNDPTIAQLDERNFAETESGLRTLLGAARYDQLQKYRESLDDRNSLLSLRNLVQTSYRTDHPVTLDQMNRLAAITAEAGLFNYTKATTTPGGVPFSSVEEQARRILRPEQMQVFELLLDQRQMSLGMSKILQDRPKP